MNPDVKEQWIAALESGDYQQGTGALHYVDDGTAYLCCLGVLCDLSVKAGAIAEPIVETGDWFSYGVPDDDMSNAELPKAVREWAGLPDANPFVDYGEVRETLGELNDEEHRTFPEIAAIIREQL